MEIPRPNLVVGVNENYYGMYVPAVKTIFLTSLSNEFNVEWILNHETIHHVLEHRIDHDASVKLDNVDLDLWVLLNHGSDRAHDPYQVENVLQRMRRITKSFFSRLPSAFF